MPSARRVNWAKFRVSAVCLVAILILVTLIYLLTGGSLLQPKATVHIHGRLGLQQRPSSQQVDQCDEDQYRHQTDGRYAELGPIHPASRRHSTRIVPRPGDVT